MGDVKEFASIEFLPTETVYVLFGSTIHPFASVQWAKSHARKTKETVLVWPAERPPGKSAKLLDRASSSRGCLAYVKLGYFHSVNSSVVCHVNRRNKSVPDYRACRNNQIGIRVIRITQAKAEGNKRFFFAPM